MRDYPVERGVDLNLTPQKPGTPISGYLLLWGSSFMRDCKDTWHDRERPAEIGIPPFIMMYKHGKTGRKGIDVVGEVTSIKEDDTGIRFNGFVYFGQHHDSVMEEIDRGVLFISPGTSTHTMEFDEDGRFVIFPFVEVTLTDNPCEARMPKVSQGHNLRSKSCSTCSCRNKDMELTQAQKLRIAQRYFANYLGQNIRDFSDLGLPPETDPVQVVQALIDELGSIQAVMDIVNMISDEAPDTEEAMEPQEEMRADGNPDIQSVVESAVRKAMDANTRSAPEVDALRKQLDQQRQANQRLLEQALTPKVEKNAQGQNRNVRDGKTCAVRDLRYDHMTAHDMVTGYRWMKEFKLNPSEDYIRAMESKASSHLRDANTEFTRRMNLELSAMNIRDGDVMNTIDSGIGGAWTSTYHDNQLWEQVRVEGIVPFLIEKGMVVREVPRSANEIKLHLEGADPEVYSIGETTQVDPEGDPRPKLSPTTYGTASVTLGTSKIGAAVPISSEAQEDTFIEIMPEANRKLVIAMQEAIEYAILNGDTAATANTNINAIDGIPPVTALGSNPKYMAFDGMIKNALLGASGTNAWNVDTLTVNDYLKLLTLLNDGVDAAAIDKVCFISDTATKYAALSIGTLQNQDTFIPGTIISGMIQVMFNRAYYASGQMGLANTAGKISVTPANNTKGRILLVRPDRWTMAQKRETTVEIERYARADTTYMVTFARIGLAKRNEEASAIGYNVNTAFTA